MSTKQHKRKNLRELTVYAMLAAVMFVSKIAMEGLPNIHLLGCLTVAYTVAFRARALIPIYLYVMLNGLFAGFSAWWLPYLYIWAILWGLTMLLPKKMPRGVALVIYPLLSALHGIFFGTLYAPVQALLYDFDFKQTMAWIAAGLSFDILHAVGNLLAGLLILPIAELLIRLKRRL